MGVARREDPVYAGFELELAGAERNEPSALEDWPENRRTCFAISFTRGIPVRLVTGVRSYPRALLMFVFDRWPWYPQDSAESFIVHRGKPFYLLV